MKTQINTYLRTAGLLACAFLLNACQKPEMIDNSQPVAQVSGRNSQTLFQSVSQVDEASASEEEAPEATVSVQVDLAYLKQVAAQGVNSSLVLNLTSDRQVTGTVQSVQQVSADNMIVRGQIGSEGSFMLVLNKDVLVGHVQLPEMNEAYEIARNSQGVQVIRPVAIEDNCETGESEAVGAEPEVTEEEAMNAVSGPTQIATASTTPVIDMLVAYTPAARAAQGGADAMKALIQMGIADTNRAFRESGVRAVVRLVGTIEVTSNETGNFKGDLSRLTNDGDGKWDEVHRERARLRADQVTLVAKNFGNSSTAGIGWIRSGKERAFTLVKSNSFGQYSFTHELGHNLGLDHPNGYRSNSGRFRTIIAYPPYVRILRFSNPSIQYNGHATGDSRHNEAGIINTNVSKMAAFN